jgi:ABC-type polysaccharide/polyol phosphate export permease
MNKPPLSITVSRANQRHELGFLQAWAVMSRNIWNARELIWQLFKRDFLAGYKKSFIGFAWLFIAPLMGIVSWLFLQKTGMLQPGETGVPYPVYVLVGTSMWGLFISMLTAAGGTLDAGAGLLMQVKFPHEALLFKQVAQQVANFLVSFLLNIIILLCFQVYPSWGIILFPLVVLPLFLLAAGVGLMVSLISAVAYDLKRAVELSVGVLMYSVPIIYSGDIHNPMVQLINRWNPLTYLVCSCRDIVIYGQLYHPKGFFIAAAFSLLLFLVSWRLFYVSEDKIIERMV